MRKKLDRLIEAHSASSRDAKMRFMISALSLGPQCSILDIGFASREYHASDNYLEKHYPWREKITALGLDDMTEAEARFPEITFVRGDGRDLPFRANEFDVCHANAVLEHVGDRDDRVAFVRELCRVGRSVFIAIPNVRFPFESHSRLPFVHYLPARPRSFAYRLLGHPWVADEVGFIKAREIPGMFPSDCEVALHYVGTMPLKENVVAVARTEAVGT